MKDILLAMAHYGSTNRNYFLSCLREYNSFKKYVLDVHLYLTEELDVSEFSNLKITQHIFDPSIGHYLTHEHKQLFAENLDLYNYFIYSEDDMLITESHMDAYVGVQLMLSTPFVCGFMRYELRKDSDYKFLIDNHPIHSCHRGGNRVVKDNYMIFSEPYFEVYNFHQAFYILPNSLMRFVLNSGRYMENDYHYAGILEGAASNIFFKCGLIKIIPRNRVSEFIVHHLSDRYANRADLAHIYTTEQTPDDEKMKIMQLDLPPIYV